MSDQTPIEKLTAALQEFLNETDPEAPVIIRSAAFAWETMILDEDGDAMHSTGYASADGTSVAGTVGVFDIGKQMVLRDMVVPNDGV